MGIIFCIPALHGRRMDLRGFREIYLKSDEKKEFVRARKEKNQKSAAAVIWQQE